MLKKSVNPMELLAPKRRSSFSTEAADQSLDATKFDEDCGAFQKDLDRIRANIKRPKESDINPAFEDIVAYLLNYCIPLTLLGDQLNTFGSMLHFFANGLQSEEASRLKKLADEVLQRDSLASPRGSERKGGSYHHSPRRATLSTSPPALMKSRSFSIHERLDLSNGKMHASGPIASLIPALRLSSTPPSSQQTPKEPQFIPDTSTLIPKMDPEKFVETGQLLLLVQRCVQDVSKLIRDDITLATPEQKVMRKEVSDDAEFLL